MNVKAIKYGRIKRQAPEKEIKIVVENKTELDPASLLLAQRVYAARRGQ